VTVFAPVGAYEFTAWYPRLETQPKYQSAQVRVPVIYQITGYAKLLRAPGVPHRGLARNRRTAGREAALWWSEPG
jgi:hypothetical protein